MDVSLQPFRGSNTYSLLLFFVPSCTTHASYNLSLQHVGAFLVSQLPVGDLQWWELIKYSHTDVYWWDVNDLKCIQGGEHMPTRTNGSVSSCFRRLRLAEREGPPPDILTAISMETVKSGEPNTKWKTSSNAACANILALPDWKLFPVSASHTWARRTPRSTMRRTRFKLKCFFS